ITDRKRLEEQLFQAQKIESLGLLAGGIAHDFNNLLTALLGYASLLERRCEGADPKVRRAVTQILQTTSRAQELTASLLSFSRKRILRPSALDLNEVVTAVAGLVETTLGEERELVVERHSGPLPLWGDPSQLEHTVLNLAANARDAMPGGGRLTLRTDRVDLDAARAQALSGAPGAYVELTIADSGEGIAPRDLPRIFEPFFTTKAVGRGTGLGLAMVYGTVEQHGGLLGVQSEQGRGTTFRLYFPVLERPPVPVTAGPGPEEAAPPAPPLTILLAEDNGGAREFLCEALGERNHRVLAAGDGAQALALYEAHREEIDFVVLDLVMPRVNGKEVYDRLRQADPRIPVLFLSGYTRDVLTARGIESEGLAVLAKPVQAGALLRKVDELWWRRAPGARPTADRAGAEAAPGRHPEPEEQPWST
ncbi:MAG: ATP-binding protein, partial [Deferrisomatales bacterium]